ncbi:MAG: right-handed parallel beta-helix repeat-containing protein [Candidatus Thermoplasmatota archaeon]|nr:right-handed parallel beta-helix repeat-containing protein [Candidatus Thermoplasmatota archaeon]
MSAKGVWVAYLALGLLVAGLVVSAQQNIWNQNEKNIVKASGDEIIDSAITWFNLTKIMDGNLTITSTGKLTLRNVTLIMNCTINGQYYIEVQSGGEMYILNNSNITSAREFHYLFWVRNNSTFEMRDSEFHGCGYANWTEPSHRGLFIQANNTVIANNLISNNYYGIFLYQSSDGLILDNNISSNQDGIELYYSTNNLISNNQISSSISVGIYLDISSTHNILLNNTIKGDGISGDYGIVVSQSNNNTISNNKVSSEDYGIYLDSSGNITIVNCSVLNSETGISLEDYSHNNRLISNEIRNNKYDGIRLDNSDNNTLIGNLLYNNSYDDAYGGIRLSHSDNNLIFNCSMINNFYNGIIISHSSSNIVDSCNISGNEHNGTRVEFSKNNAIVNSTISGNYSNLSYRDIYLWGDSILSLVNTTFNSSSVFIISPLAILNVSWYLNVKVIDTDAKPIHYANVAVRDNHSKLVGNFATDKGGWAKYIPCMAYSENITGRDYSMNNHSIVVGNNTQSHNMSENQEIVMPVSYFSIASPVPTALSYENYLIVQENNLTITENGTLTLSNITLKMNCSYNGSLAIEVLSGGEMYILNNSNITSTNSNNHYLFWVRNDSKFEMRDSELSECGYDYPYDSAGLWVNTDNAIIENSTLSWNYKGIILDCSNWSTISNTTISYNNNDGVDIISAMNSSIANCTINNNCRGIVLDYSINNIVIDCTIYNVFGGFHLEYSSYNIITNCTIYDSDIGIYLGLSSVNIITNCVIYNGSQGIQFSFSLNNIVENCAIYNSSGWGIYMSSSSDYNNIIKCTIYNNSYNGIKIVYSSNNTITNCTIYNNSPYGIHIYWTYLTIYPCPNNTKIINCAIYNNSWAGIKIDSSLNTDIINCVIYNSSSGISLYNSSNNVMTNSSIYNNFYDLYLSEHSMLHCLNTTFDKSKVQFPFGDYNSTLNVSWYLHINVLWNNSVPAEEANVSVRDFNCTFDMINRITDLFGWVKDIVVQEYTQNQTNTTYFIPYNVNASQGAFWNSTSIPITNTLELILYLNQPFPHNAPEISDISPDLKYTITEGVRVEFKFNIFHQNNLTLTYYWYFSDVEVKNNTLENTNITQELNWSKYFDYLSGSEIGTEYKIKIKISDSNATVSRTWKVIVINIDAPPEITSYEPKWYTMSITEEQIITFTVVVFEADCDAISYWWYVYYENVTEWVKTYGGVNATGTQSFGPFDAAGNYTVLVNVSSYNATLNESLTVTHNWLLRVWNVTELSQQLANLQQQINTMNDTITNLNSNLTQSNATISSLQDQLDTLNGTVSNLSAQISDLNTQLCDAMRRRNESIAAEDEAKRIAAEALKAMHEAQYRLAAGVIGGVLAGIFAGAFVLALSTRRKKK